MVSDDDDELRLPIMRNIIIILKTIIPTGFPEYAILLHIKVNYKQPTKCWLHWQWSPLKWLDWVCSPVRVAGKSPLLGEPVPPGSSGDF